MNPLDLPFHLLLAGWLYRKLGRRIQPEGAKRHVLTWSYWYEYYCLTEILEGFYPSKNRIVRLCASILDRHARKLKAQSDFLNAIGCDVAFTVKKG